MRSRRQPSPTSFSDEGDDTDLESCFDTSDEAGSTTSDTVVTDYGTDVEDGDEGRGLFLAGENEDEDHPPEYYLNQEETFDESEYMDEDYGENTSLLLDFIEERFSQ